MTISTLCRRHRFPREVIAHAVWLHARFPLSLVGALPGVAARPPAPRLVERRLLLERGIDVSYETVRRWGMKSGPALARELRRRAPRPGDVWHLD